MAYIGNAPYQGSVAGTNILDGTIETVDLKDGNVTGAKLETLAGLTSGTYGNSTAIPAITIDVKGRVTAISTTAVSIPSGSISVTGGDLTLSGSTGTAITDATLTSVGTAGTYTKVTTDAKGRVTSGTTLASSDLPTYTGTITSSQVTTALGFTPENIANKAVANGYASLDGSGKVPSAQLPSYVDDVLEYANLAAFPATGSSGIIYVTQDTNKTYRWTGSAYVEISPSPGTTDSLTEGSTNLYYTNTRARASLSFTAGSGAYNSTTGAITIPTNTTHLTNGSGYITGNQTVTLSGDASGSGATAITVTLASSGVTAGTYNNVTVDAKGRVTSGSNASYLTTSGKAADSDLLDGQDSTGFLRLLSGGAEASIDSYTDNGFRTVSYTGHSKHMLSWNAGGSTGTVQQEFFYNTPANGWRIRNKTDNSSWSSWGNVVMASSNQGLISGTIYHSGNPPPYPAEADTLATVTGRGNSTSTNIGSTSGTPLALATAGNVGTWIGGIQDGTSGWSLSQATIGFKSDNNTYAAIGIGTAQGLLYFGRTTASGVGSMASWLEVNSNGVANFVRARPQHNGSNLALVSEIPSLSGYLTSESDTLATVTARGASASVPITITGNGSYRGDWGYSTLILQDTGGYPGINYRSGNSNWLVRMNAGGSQMDWAYSSNASAQGVGGYTQYLTLSTSVLSHPSSMRAPIFYDSDDTSYYINPASTSILSRLSLAGGAGGTNAGLTVTSIANGTGPIVAKSRNHTTVWSILPWGDGGTYISSGTYYDNSSWVHASSDSTNCLLFLKGSGPTWYSSNDGATTWNLASGASLWQNDGRWINNVTSPSDVRAPIFYDSNNTGYYVDPNNTGTSGVFAGQLVVGDGIRAATSSYITPYNLFALSDTYDGGSYYGIKYVEGSPDTIQIIGANNVGLSIGMDVGDTTASSSLRAPIFYDSNDTNYYLDPASTSVIRNLKVNTSGTSSSTRALTIKQEGQAEISFGSYPASWTSALQIQNNNNTDIIWISPLDDGYNARFRTGGSGLDFYTDGGTADAGTYSAFIGSGYLQGISSVRGPIFYDSNDTNYYLDPNSTSRLYYLRPNMISLVNNQDNGTPRWDFKAYVVESQHHYAHNSTQSMYIGEDNYIYMRTHTEASGSHRAPVFYDSNNTGYYIDPASTSNFSALNVGGSAVLTAGNYTSYISSGSEPTFSAFDGLPIGTS